MTRQDYVLIAAALHDARPTPSAVHRDVAQSRWQTTCRAMANRLATENPSFDQIRFLHACVMGG